MLAVHSRHMKFSLALVAGLLVGLSVASCGTTKGNCSPTNCPTGCCTADTGVCISPTTTAACGDKGSVCRACMSKNVCSAGACVPEGSVPNTPPGTTPPGSGGGTPNPGGTGGGGPSGSGGGSGTGGGSATGDDCSAEAKLVYLVDNDNTFSSFAPKELPAATAIKDLGKLNCPASRGASPFSMAVDREAVAWVVFNNGELFKVEIKNSLKCTKVDLTPTAGFGVFGMGFVSDAPMATTEKLYVGGNPSGQMLMDARLGVLSTTSPFKITDSGKRLSGSPEFTGTGDAKLWAFAPDTNPPKVFEVDKASGAAGMSYNLPSIAGKPTAWAFAFWGGDFFIFLERLGDDSTTVYRVSGKDGKLTTAIENTGRVIVGAGVSTCAPTSDVN
jgi:hypothetical protein